MNKQISPPLPGTLIDPRHPDSDGRPMGDTDYHSIAMILLRQGLEDFFAPRPDVYVGSNLIYYWEEGDAGKRRDPDALVAKGVVGKHRRRSYRLWEEKVIPCTFFEMASKKTWRKDLYEKPVLYARLGIKEYFLYDPEGVCLDPVLLGFRSVKSEPRPMKPAKDGSLVSKQLGLRLVPEGEMLRLIDLATEEPVLTRSEQAEREHQLRQEERRRAEELEAEVARLRRLLDRPS